MADDNLPRILLHIVNNKTYDQNYSRELRLFCPPIIAQFSRGGNTFFYFLKLCLFKNYGKIYTTQNL